MTSTTNHPVMKEMFAYGSKNESQTILAFNTYLQFCEGKYLMWNVEHRFLSSLDLVIITASKKNNADVEVHLPISSQFDISPEWMDQVNKEVDTLMGVEKVQLLLCDGDSKCVGYTVQSGLPTITDTGEEMSNKQITFLKEKLFKKYESDIRKAAKPDESINKSNPSNKTDSRDNDKEDLNNQETIAENERSNNGDEGSKETRGDNNSKDTISITKLTETLSEREGQTEEKQMKNISKDSTAENNVEKVGTKENTESISKNQEPENTQESEKAHRCSKEIKENDAQQENVEKNDKTDRESLSQDLGEATSIETINSKQGQAEKKTEKLDFEKGEKCERKLVECDKRKEEGRETTQERDDTTKQSAKDTNSTNNEESVQNVETKDNEIAKDNKEQISNESDNKKANDVPIEMKLEDKEDKQVGDESKKNIGTVDVDDVETKDNINEQNNLINEQKNQSSENDCKATSGSFKESVSNEPEKVGESETKVTQKNLQDNSKQNKADAENRKDTPENGEDDELTVLEEKNSTKMKQKAKKQIEEVVEILTSSEEDTTDEENDSTDEEDDSDIIEVSSNEVSSNEDEDETQGNKKAETSDEESSNSDIEEIQVLKTAHASKYKHRYWNERSKKKRKTDDLEVLYEVDDRKSLFASQVVEVVYNESLDTEPNEANNLTEDEDAVEIVFEKEAQNRRKKRNRSYQRDRCYSKKKRFLDT